MKSTLWALICTLLIVPPGADARTWLVRQNGSGDCTSIQACVDSTAAGDTVLVGPGTYSEYVKVPSTGIVGVVVRSELGPSVTVIRAPTIDDAVVKVYQSCVVSGFTIRDGRKIFGPARAGGADVGNATLRNCLIVNNTSEGIDGPGYAGGVAVSGNSVIEGNTIVSNGYWVIAGGIYCTSNFTGEILRNIVAQNTDGYGIYCEPGASPALVCNNVWGNADGQYGGACTDPTGTNGNISVDPLFCDPENDNYTLHAGSPCLDAPGCGLMGAFGQGCPATSVEEHFTTWGKIKGLFR